MLFFNGAGKGNVSMPAWTSWGLKHPTAAEAAAIVATLRTW
jgi:hypothetical protein